MDRKEQIIVTGWDCPRAHILVKLRDNMNEIKIREKLTTHKHGKEYHHCVAEIGMKVGLDYNNMNAIMRKLFLKDLRSEYTLLILEIRELYAFVINNKRRLIENVYKGYRASAEVRSEPEKYLKNTVNPIII